MTFDTQDRIMMWGSLALAVFIIAITIVGAMRQDQLFMENCLKHFNAEQCKILANVESDSRAAIFSSGFASGMAGAAAGGRR